MELNIGLMGYLIIFGITILTQTMLTECALIVRSTLTLRLCGIIQCYCNIQDI